MDTGPDDDSQAARALPARSQRRALLVGINYLGQTAQLNGCVNDVYDMRRLCEELRYDKVCVLYDGIWPEDGVPFNKEDARVVNPKTGRPDIRPTRANILAGFTWLTAGASEGDTLLFHYSGHGGQLAELVFGAEEDGMDETIVPVDYQRSEHIRDDEVRQRLVEPLRGTGASLRAVLDCCHSGTGFDLKYNFTLVDADCIECIQRKRTLGKVKPGQKAAARALSKQGVVIATEGDGALDTGEDTAGDTAGDAAEKAAEKAAEDTAEKAAEDTAEKAAPGAFIAWGQQGRNRRSRAPGTIDAMLISGCTDCETSTDTVFGGRAGGALTHYLVAYLRKCGRRRSWPTAAAILQNLRRQVKTGGFDQAPQFSSEQIITQATRFNLT